jgi:uncharacterized membrane protein YedE/YeeE
MKLIVSFILGTLFSMGLSISGMVNPDKVLGWLDFFGAWDPSLIFVMGGAVTVNILFFKLILKRKHPLLENKFSVPTKTVVDNRLLVGSALFGIGWGLGGVCPGPGLSNLFLFNPKVIAFLVAMVFGMIAFKWVDEKTNILKALDKKDS